MTSNPTETGPSGTAAWGIDVARLEGLVRQAQRGEGRAFDRLAGLVARPMYNLAYRMAGNPEDAGDLTQDILVKLYRSIGSFRWQSSFSTWLYALAANTCRSGLRRLRRIASMEVVHLDARDEAAEYTGPREAVDGNPTPAVAMERTEVADEVHRAIVALERDFRIVIVLRDLQGLAYEEIAEALGCSLGTVKSRLARARLKVKERLVKRGLTCVVAT